MTELLEIQGRKIRLAEAEQELVASVKTGIRQGLVEAFEDPNVDNIAFGVSSEPYNDEGCGQGTFGPLVNYVQFDDDIDPDEGWTDYEFEHDEQYDLFYGSGADGSNHPAVAKLTQIFDEAKWKYTALALGVPADADAGNYSNTATRAFIARRDSNKKSGFSLTTYEAGEY